MFPIGYMLVEGAITFEKQVSKTMFDNVLTSKTNGSMSELHTHLRIMEVNLHVSSPSLISIQFLLE